MVPKNIYPNFNRNIKWRGIIEYKSLAIIGIYSTLIINILRLITHNILLSLYITIIFTIPVFIIFYSNLGQDNVYYMLKTVLIFILSKKSYRYKLDNKKYKVDFL